MLLVPPSFFATCLGAVGTPRRKLARGAVKPRRPLPQPSPSPPPGHCTALHCTGAFSPSFRLCPPGFGAPWIGFKRGMRVTSCFALLCLGSRLCLASAVHCVGQGRGAAHPSTRPSRHFSLCWSATSAAAKLPVNPQLQPPLLGLRLCLCLLVLGVRPPPPPSSCFVLLLVLLVLLLLPVPPRLF